VEPEQKLDEALQNAEKLLVLERLLDRYKTSMLREIRLDRWFSSQLASIEGQGLVLHWLETIFLL